MWTQYPCLPRQGQQTLDSLGLVMTIGQVWKHWEALHITNHCLFENSLKEKTSQGGPEVNQHPHQCIMKDGWISEQFSVGFQFPS